MSTFDNIILNGRPGGGKSELIDFLRDVPLPERVERYHLGQFVELDDFVWLWDKFVEDDLWEQVGVARKYSRAVPGGYVQLEGDRLLDMLILKLDRVARRDYASKPGFYDDHSMFLEYSRGVPDGGYLPTYEAFSDEILERAVLFYIAVSFEESQRKNEARYQEKLAHSILAHRLPEEGVERFSRHQDFLELTNHEPAGYLEVRGHRVPYVTMDNEPELTEHDALAERYGTALDTLWALHQNR